MPTRPTPRRPTKTAGDVRGAPGGAKAKGRGSATSTGGEPLTPAPSPSQPRLWSEAAADVRARSRDAFLVPADAVQVRTDPTILPETPHESDGLFELVGPIARRALELGLAAREPSFHVFVAAEPEVMIEDDIVRYAQRFAASRPSPPDTVYVHDFEHPSAPRPIVLPAGVGPILVDSMKQLVEKLRHDMPSIARADVVQKATSELATQLEARNKQVVTELETTAKSLGFGIRAVQGGVQTFPILHGKPVSPEQFAALDESTKRALGEAEGQLTKEVEQSAQLVKQAGATFEAAREEAFGLAASALIDTSMKAFIDAFSPYGRDVVAYLERVAQALKEDWEDLLQGESNEEETDDPTRDVDPEHATRLSRFRVNLFVTNEPGAPAPVLYETNPTYPNLFGYLERRARFGALLTDFTRIRAGVLHKASGGVLVVRAADLLTDPIISGAHEARLARAADRRGRPARTARPLRDVAPPRAGSDPGAGRARRPAGALRDAAPGRRRLRGAVPREGRGRAVDSTHEGAPARARCVSDADGSRARVGDVRPTRAGSTARLRGSAGDRAGAGGVEPLAPRGDDGVRERARSGPLHVRGERRGGERASFSCLRGPARGEPRHGRGHRGRVARATGSSRRGRAARPRSHDPGRGGHGDRRDPRRGRQRSLRLLRRRCRVRPADEDHSRRRARARRARRRGARGAARGRDSHEGGRDRPRVSRGASSARSGLCPCARRSRSSRATAKSTATARRRASCSRC